MHLDLSQGTVSIVLVPYDLRVGYKRLASIAQDYFNINVSKQNDWVIFISKARNVAKIIKCDEEGSILITRTLHTGRYQQLMARANGIAVEPLTLDVVERYLDGASLQVKRTNPFKG